MKSTAKKGGKGGRKNVEESKFVVQRGAVNTGKNGGIAAKEGHFT